MQLKTKSNWSYNESTMTVKDLVKKAVEQNHKAVALTDVNNIKGWYELQEECEKHSIKAIYGVTMFESLTTDVQNKRMSEVNLHSIFLAKNKQGVKAIRNLMTYANNSENQNSKYGRYSVEYLLKNKAELNGNVIYLTGGINGRIGYLFRGVVEGNADYEETVKTARRHLSAVEYALGKENIYVEVENTDINHADYEKLSDEAKSEYQVRRKTAEKINQFAEDIKKNGYNVVMTNDTRYADKENEFMANLYVALRGKANIEQYVQSDKAYYRNSYLTDAEMKRDEPVNGSFESVGKIVNQIDPTKAFVKSKEFLFPSLSDSPETKLMALVNDKARILSYHYSEDEAQRVMKEMKTIVNLKNAEVFLIVEDMVRYAREKGYYIGTRGSVGGSYIAYLLGITDVNPLEYNLHFERFLNEKRVTVADIDLDVPSYAQKDIMRYLIDKYGENKTALIRTNSTYGVSTVLDDLARTMPDSYSKAISDIKQGMKQYNVKLFDELMEKSEYFRSRFENDKIYRYIKKITEQFSGVMVGESRHSGGVLLSPFDLNIVGNTSYDKKEDITVIETPLSVLKEVGLSKVDVLAVSTYDAIDYTLKDIGKTKEMFDYKKDSVYAFMCDNIDLLDTAFQVNSKGMRKLIEELQPKSIMDLANLISLHRPSTKELKEEYAKNKANPDKIKYLLPELKDILKESYGCILYQEQAMEITKVIGGFSLEQADMLRYSISSKDKTLMQSMKEDFIKGAMVKGQGLEVANEIFKDIEKFAKFGFNKAHAVQYAKIAFNTVQLINEYPHEYYKNYIQAKMNSKSFSNKQTHALYHSIGQNDHRVQIAPINVIESKYEPSIRQKNGVKMLDFGFKSIKEIDSNVRQIETVSNRHSIKTTSELIDKTGISMPTYEILVKVGAVDNLVDNMPNSIESIKKSQYKNLIEEMQYQKEVMGYSSIGIKDIVGKDNLFAVDTSNLSDGAKVTMTAVVNDVDVKPNKNNTGTYEKLSITDLNGKKHTCMNFNPSGIKKDTVMVIEGRLNAKFKTINMTSSKHIEIQQRTIKKKHKIAL